MRAIGKWSISSFVKILLDAGCILAVIVLMLSMMALALSIFSGLGGNATLSVPVFFKMDSQTIHVSSASLGIENAEIKDVRTNLAFPAQKGPFLFANLGLLTIMVGLALWVLTQLREFFRTLRDGHPFVSANATRIRRLGFAVILGELARAGLTYFENYYVMTHFTGTGIRFGAPFDISLLALIHGFIILVIAEVFRVGSRLEEEQSLTI